MRTPPIVGVPAFALMRLRPFFANMLADLKLLQAADEPRPQQQADQEGSECSASSTERHILDDVEGFQRRPVRTERIEEFIKQVVKHYTSTLEK